MQEFVLDLAHFYDNVLVLGRVEISLLVDQRKDTESDSLFYELDNLLVVRRRQEFDSVPEPVLPQILNLLLEHMFGVQFLQSLVGEIYAQLLETVVVKRLEPEDVENADTPVALSIEPQLLVDLRNQVVEHSPVQSLSQSISVDRALLLREVLYHELLPNRQFLLR